MGGCSSKDKLPPVPAFTFDFEANNSGYADIEKSLGKSSNMLKSISEYTGCDDYVKEALSEPSPETEAAAWKAVEKAADVLHKFYKYVKTLETSYKDLLLKFACNEDADTHVKQHEAEVLLLGKMFSYGFRFDEIKMAKPSIQNDFSYYRRVVGKMRNGKQSASSGKKKLKTKVGEDDANKMSFHFAFPTPVMKVFIDGAVKLPEKEEFVGSLAVIANVACAMVESAQYSVEENMLLLCVMSGCIILVDHIYPGGAYHRRSPIRIVNCLEVLKNFRQESTEFLLNSIRLSSTTNIVLGETVLPQVKRLLDG